MNTKIEMYLRDNGATISITAHGKEWYVHIAKNHIVVATATGRSPRAAINKLADKMGLK